MENCRTEPPSLRRFALIRSASAAMLACLFSVAGLQAASTWIGGTGSFSNGANWNTGYAPNGTDNVFIVNGGTAQVDDFSPTQDATIDGSSTIDIFASPNGMTNKLGVIGTLNVGVTGLGTITIGNQSLLINNELVSANTYLGYQSGAQGVINSTGGTFSTSELYVGHSGSGSMDFSSGSEIYTSTTYLGLASAAFGSVTLQGGSWSTGGDFSSFRDVTVGAGGRGELVLGDSQVQLGNLVISDGGGTNSSVTVSGGSLTSSKTIFVGRVGGASFSSTNAAVQAEALFVGRDAGASGVASVSGGSLTLSADLHVGADGTGTFTLADGGTMRSDIANVGFGTNAVGVLNISSGNWTNTRAIFVGVSGHGTLNVGAQGSILSESGYISQDAAGLGAVNITGGSWTMTNTLAVGVNGSGTFSVTGGGAVSSVWSQLGLHTGSSGTVQLNGSSWTTTNTLNIGFNGDGEFSATNGSSVSAGAVELSASAGVSSSLLVADSTLSTVNLIKGGGSASVSFSNTVFNLLGGPAVLDTLLIDGFSSGAVVIQGGSLTVDTQGGNAQINSPLTGAGSLTKTGAGRLRLNTENAYSGGTFVEQGLLEITGSSVLGTGITTVGTAELRAITNVTLSDTQPGSPPSITVTSGQTATFSATAGSTFTIATTNLTLENGAGFVAGSAGNTGTVVFAPGSVTTSSNVVLVGVQAGTLAAGNARLAELTAQAGSTTVAAEATLNFQDNLATGGINNLFGAGTVNTGTNTATTLSVNSGNFAGSISGWGGLAKNSAGTLTLTSSNNPFTGGTVVNEGTLVVNGSLSFGLGNVQVFPTGTLSGTGLVGGITLAGGTLAPGASAGTLTAEELLWEGGTLRFELGPTPAASDHLTLYGALVGLDLPSGPYTFDFVDAGWSTNTTYDLITFDTSNIALGDFNFSNGGGFAGAFAYNGNTLQFNVTTVPEPSTWALLLAAGLLAAVRLRRRA